jgi:hypothetical protein
MSLLSDYTIDWQHMVLLLYTLDNIPGDVPRKQDAILFLRNQRLITLREEDHQPYLSCGNEPSWHTDIAWSRKNAVMVGYVQNNSRDSWEISREGRGFIQSIMQRGKDQQLQVYRCCLWAPRFKNLVDPSFEPSRLDLVAPPKGDRAFQAVVRWERKIEAEMASGRTLEDMANKVGERLGVKVTPTKECVAWANMLYFRPREAI